MVKIKRQAMKTTLDCIPCFLRQALESVRLSVTDPARQERLIRKALLTLAEMNMKEPPPVIAQQLHRRLRELSGVEDPYRAIKEQLNCMALDMFPELQVMVQSAPDPLGMATRLAIAGNVIDLGAKAGGEEMDAHAAVTKAITKPLLGDMEAFRHALYGAAKILYLADNAGEIVFDRLLIALLPAGRTTLAVRGGAVINDATVIDARQAGLHEMVDVIDNGSDAPGTILNDCSEKFQKSFYEADVIISKGQGNYETLSGTAAPIFFLFKVKCPVIASHVGLPMETHLLKKNKR